MRPRETGRSEYDNPSIMKNCGVLLASPRSPRAEAAPLKGSLVSVRVRPGAPPRIGLTIYPYGQLRVWCRDQIRSGVRVRGRPVLRCHLHVQMGLHSGTTARTRLPADLENSVPGTNSLSGACAALTRQIGLRVVAVFQPLTVGPARETVTRMITRRSRTIAAR
jgi:hypothetical protein